jgi:hypothetical protein
MNNEKDFNIGILITTISILSGILLNSEIIDDITKHAPQSLVIFFIEIALLMLFSSSMYYIASSRFNDERYEEIAVIQVLISLGILAGLTMFWASVYIVAKNLQNVTPGKLITIYIYIPICSVINDNILPIQL